MNQFEIFYVLTFFYISYAPAQADREELHKIKGATIHTYSWDTVDTQVLNNGDVYLYKIVGEETGDLDFYVVEDSSDVECPEFPIAQYSTVVTDDCITIRWFTHTITLVLDKNDNTFEFYQKFFPLEKFSREFTVTNFFQDGEQLNGVTVIKAKQVEDDEWSFAVLEDDTPRIIFPEYCIRLSSKKITDDKVKLTVDRRPAKTIIIAQFDNSLNANAFFDFVKEFTVIDSSINLTSRA